MTVRDRRTRLLLGSLAGLLVAGGLTGAITWASSSGTDTDAALTATHGRGAEVGAADAGPAVVGSTYTARSGATSYTPAFDGPAPTPARPNPPAQQVGLHTGPSGVQVALENNGARSAPWVLPPDADAVVTVNTRETVVIADAPTGTTAGSVTVTWVDKDQRLAPARIHATYTSVYGSPGYTAVFTGPTSTPTGPNPPTQYISVAATAGTAQVALQSANGAVGKPWTLAADQTVTVPVTSMETVALANTPPAGTPSTISVTAVTSTPS